jgi:hypothetical protein
MATERPCGVPKVVEKSRHARLTGSAVKGWRPETSSPYSATLLLVVRGLPALNLLDLRLWLKQPRNEGSCLGWNGWRPRLFRVHD